MIDNAVHGLLKELTGNEDLEWDMEVIGDVTEFIENKINERGYSEICHPYYSEEEYPTHPEDNERVPCFKIRRDPEKYSYLCVCECDHCPFDVAKVKELERTPERES